MAQGCIIFGSQNLVQLFFKCFRLLECYKKVNLELVNYCETISIGYEWLIFLQTLNQNSVHLVLKICIKVCSRIEEGVRLSFVFHIIICRFLEKTMWRKCILKFRQNKCNVVIFGDRLSTLTRVLLMPCDITDLQKL